MKKEIIEKSLKGEKNEEKLLRTEPMLSYLQNLPHYPA